MTKPADPAGRCLGRCLGRSCHDPVTIREPIPMPAPPGTDSESPKGIACGSVHRRCLEPLGDRLGSSPAIPRRPRLHSAFVVRYLPPKAAPSVGQLPGSIVGHLCSDLGVASGSPQNCPVPPAATKKPPRRTAIVEKKRPVYLALVHSAFLAEHSAFFSAGQVEQSAFLAEHSAFFSAGQPEHFSPANADEPATIRAIAITLSTFFISYLLLGWNSGNGHVVHHRVQKNGFIC